MWASPLLVLPLLCDTLLHAVNNWMILTFWTWCWILDGTHATPHLVHFVFCTSQTACAGWREDSTQPKSSWCLSAGRRRRTNDCLCLAVNIPKQGMAISVSFVYLYGNLNPNSNSTTEWGSYHYIYCIWTIIGGRELLSNNQSFINGERWDWRVSWSLFRLSRETRCPWAASLTNGGRERKERVGWAGHTGREESVVGLGNTASPSFSTRPEKNPGSVWLLKGFTQQHKHTPVAVKGPSLKDTPCKEPVPAPR